MLTDTLTFLIFALLLIGFLGVLQIWLWRRDRALVVLGIWGTAHLTAAAGIALLAGRNILPGHLSIDVANALLCFGYGVAWLGARRLEHQTIPIPVAAAGALIWLVACQIPLFYQSLPARIVGVALIAATYEVMTMHEFLRERTGALLPSRRALGTIFGVLAMLQIARAAAALIFGFDQSSFSLPDSPWFTVSAMVGIVLVAGTSVLLIAVAKEEAEQRSIASLALARDTSDRANVAKSRFLARMSHELRTPLNGVLGMAQALTRDPVLGGVQRERVVLLEQAGRHLLAIVSDLLDLASVEAGKFELAPRPVLVRDIIHGGVDLVAETAAGKDVDLRVEFGPIVPQAVLADPLRVRQVVVNLLGNAIKFTPRNGRVTLAVSRHDREGWLRLDVTDTGPGVPDNVVPHLFEDFTQNRAAHVPSEGTGLGLAISASLVQAMGGSIIYQPGQKGVGSTFMVELPLPSVEPPASFVPEPMPMPRPDVRVLVVDDVASNRKVAEAFLQQAGLSVTLAEDGPSALAALARGPVPDLVLMDVYMPGMDGLMATRRIRALGGAAGKVPIVALTADISLEQAQTCRQAGMNGYITKPLDFGELLAAIATAVPGAAASPPVRGDVTVKRRVRELPQVQAPVSPAALVHAEQSWK